MRGEFYRQSLICGAALYSVATRLLTLISGFFSENITAENLVKIIEQTTGYKSTSIDISLLKNIMEVSSEKKSEKQWYTLKQYDSDNQGCQASPRVFIALHCDKNTRYFQCFTRNFPYEHGAKTPDS